jgi:ABC-type multidrug transport system ATPase subunit
VTAILVAQGLCQQYGAQKVLDGIDLTLEGGQVTVILGENGAGKSTLLRTLACELAAPQGAMRIGDLDAIAAPESAATQLIHVAQHPPLAQLLTPLEHVQALIAFRALEPDETQTRMQHIAQALRIDTVLHRPVRALSGGTAHKVALMLAFLARTPLILLDEPHAGLDVRSALALRALIRESRDAGTSLVLASHLAEATLAVADRALVLAKGRWALDLDARQLAEFKGDARKFEAAVLQAMG